jgi:hypothetical protein
MYLYHKKSQSFHCQSSRYEDIRLIFGTKNKGKLICNSPNDIISGNFDSEKVDQDGIFYYIEGITRRREDMTFYLRVVKTIFYERTQRVSKILFLTREDKSPIFKPSCNVLFIIIVPSKKLL